MINQLIQEVGWQLQRIHSGQHLPLDTHRLWLILGSCRHRCTIQLHKHIAVSECGGGFSWKNLQVRQHSMRQQSLYSQGIDITRTSGPAAMACSEYKSRQSAGCSISTRLATFNAAWQDSHARVRPSCRRHLLVLLLNLLKTSQIADVMIVVIFMMIILLTLEGHWHGCPAQAPSCQSVPYLDQRHIVYTAAGATTD